METANQTTLVERLISVARANSDCAAIADSTGRRFTYGELLGQAKRQAAWLLQSRPDEHNIGIYLPATVTAAITNYAVTIAGKIAVNLNFTAGPKNCCAAIDRCGLHTILTSRAFICKIGADPLPEMVFVEDIPAVLDDPVYLPDIAPDSTACILFSSGSTGIPKDIELTHWNILANAAGLAARIPPTPDDCMLGVLPFFHSFGYTFALWFPVLHGIRAVYHTNPTDAKIIGDLAAAHKATYFAATPTFCQHYAQKLEREQFASLKYILVGAEKLQDSVAREFKARFGIELLAGYGCTELGPGVAVNTPGESRAGSVGRPLKGIEVRIVDPETFNPLPPGQAGMILINGPSRMRGYYGDPKQTAQAMCDGFYVTGDLGYLDSDGFLYVTDRLARFSKVAGEMIPHLRIEEAISDLTPSFVTGIADGRRGERLVLLYTNVSNNPEAIQKRLSESELPALWIPKKEDIHFVPSIPVLPTGKLDLLQARELATLLSSARERALPSPRNNGRT